MGIMNIYYEPFFNINCDDPQCEKCNPYLEGLSYEEDEEDKVYCSDCGQEIEWKTPIYQGISKKEEWFCEDCVCEKCKSPPKIIGECPMHSSMDEYECFKDGFCKKCSK